MMRNLVLLPVALAAEANPIRRVVTLLQNLQKEIEAEGEKEEALMDKHTCFCKQNTEGMTAKAEAAKAKIVQLTSQVESDSSAKDKTDTEITEAKNDRAAAQATIKKQKGIREKEAAAYADTVGDQKSNIDAVSRAIDVLGKGTSLMQLEAGSLARLRRVAMTAKLSAYDKDEMMSFLGIKQGNPYGEYQAASGEIVGILKQMKDQMDVDLKGAIAEEDGKKKSFAALIQSQEEVVKAANKAVERKTVRSGELAVAVAEGKNELKDTQASLTELERFMANLSVACDNKDSEWAERQKTRSEEIAAIHDAIKFLNDDDALEIFKKTLPSPGRSFLQVVDSKQKNLQKAVAFINTSAKLTSNPTLSLLAFMMKQGKVSFAKVLKMIDDMVVLLKKEQTTDDKHLDTCRESIDAAEDAIKELNHKTDGHESKMEEYQGAIENLKSKQTELKAAISSTNSIAAEASKQRKEENAEYVKSYAETNAAIQLINKAKNRLNKFYNPSLVKPKKQRELSDEDRVYQNLGGELAAEPEEMIAGTTQSVNFLQIRLHNHQMPKAPETFGAYKSKGQKSGGITALMDMLVADLKKSMTEMESDEKHDAKEYAELMAESKKQLKADTESLSQSSSALANKESKLSETNDNLAAATAEKNDQKAIEADLHGNCDWLSTNYDIRKANRANEMDALKQAKATLKGADFS